MIGDGENDVKAGNDAGCKKSFLLSSNNNLGSLIQKILTFSNEENK